MRGQLRHLVVAISMTAAVLALASPTAAGPAQEGRARPGQAQPGDRASEACHRGGAGSAGRGPEHSCNGEPSSAGVAKGDFDGDTIGDLAIGVPLEDIGSIKDAGAVHVIYGTSSGLSGAGNQLWHQDVAEVTGVAQAFDQYGAALASGDFDNDGYSDLAVGVPGETIGSATGAGAVHVMYGGPNGLAAIGQQLIVQGLDGMRGTPETGDRFGQTLAWGRFDGGLTGDLAIGAPNEDVGNVTNAGAVNVIYGVQDLALRSYGGPGNQLFTQAEVGLVPEPYDGFGATMTAGDLDGNSHTDLAVAAHNESVAYDGRLLEHAGRVTVIFANVSGLGISRAHLTRWNVASYNESGDHDHFGFSLATAGVGKRNLIVGIPWADFYVACGGCDAEKEKYVNAGLTQVFEYAAETGRMRPLGSSGNALEDRPESGALYGYAMAVGNFDGVGFQRVAVGAPGALGGAGAVFVPSIACDHFYSGYRAMFSQGNLTGEPEAGDGLGSSLSAWDFSGDKLTDLAIGVPGEDLLLGGVEYRDAGTIHVLYGTQRDNYNCDQFDRGEEGGLSLASEQRIQQGGAISGVPLQGTVEAYDEFGRALY